MKSIKIGNVVISVLSPHKPANKKDCTTNKAMSTNSNGSVKDSDHKAPMHLILWKPVRWLIRIRLYGLKKYTNPLNYKGIEPIVWYDACLRHLAKWQDGEQFDQESGLPHLAHALCNLMYLIEIVEDEAKF